MEKRKKEIEDKAQEATWHDNMITSQHKNYNNKKSFEDTPKKLRCDKVESGIFQPNPVLKFLVFK